MVSVFLDLSKAFDTVCHKILMEKLYRYGIRGNAYNLIKSYLSDRFQMVTIDESFSTRQKVTCGVPQGTVLGPVLFLLYVNSIFSSNLQGTITSFADDTVITYTSASWVDLKCKIENDFQNLEKWLQFNKLTINYKKTKYLPFCSYKTGLPQLGPINIGNNIAICEGHNVKYLGILIDRHLRWNLHCKEVVNKIRGHIPKFRILRDFLDIKSLKSVYFALVESILSYGILGWGGVYDQYLNGVHVVQKWVLRIIYSKNILFSTDKLYNELQVKDIRQLYFQKILLFLYKERDVLTSYSHCYNTRHHDGVIRPRPVKTIGQRNAYYLAPRIYAMVPKHLKTINKYSKYKRQIKKWITETNRSIFSDLINSK